VRTASFCQMESRMSESEERNKRPMSPLEEFVTEVGLAGVLMGLEGICEERVQSDPDHAAYWAIMGYRLGLIVYPPDVMFHMPTPK
jgi:hypothetical protein